MPHNPYKRTSANTGKRRSCSKCRKDMGRGYRRKNAGPDLCQECTDKLQAEREETWRI